MVEMGIRPLFVAKLDLAKFGEQGSGGRQPRFVGDEHERDDVFGKFREGRRFIVVLDAQAASKLKRADYYRWVFDRKPDWQNMVPPGQ